MLSDNPYASCTLALKATCIVWIYKFCAFDSLSTLLDWQI